MQSKEAEKKKAIELRKQGLTYREILAQLPVAKSSLSLWFSDMPLSKEEKIVLKKRKDSNISKGRIMAAASNRKHKIARGQNYLIEAKKEFVDYVSEPLFHTGVSLYWAEGAKRNDSFLFMNSDSTMIETMLKWIEKYTEYGRRDLGFRLYLHQPFMHQQWEKWWAKELQVDLSQFKKTIIKPTNLSVKKRPNYKGCIRVEVPRSTKLLTKMKFWINMIVESYNNQ
ncbi:MAG: hypothetical protein RLZZ480_115 [Candidatus Parcubacteria bacterium]|jgi:hypothetical protein